MLACTDVFYSNKEATAGCIVFENWNDTYPLSSFIVQVKGIRPYKPGRFFERELPCILAALKKVPAPLDIVVIDGYVWLGDEKSPGLGAYLYHALKGKVPVIGVAKSKFKGAELAEKVFRGRSKRPLYITAQGIEPPLAASYIKQMHGSFRIPVLLRLVDRLCRNAIKEGLPAVLKGGR